MLSLFIIMLATAIVVDLITLGVVGYSLHQAITNLTALRALNLRNGRLIVAKALIRRTAIQAMIVLLLALVSSYRIFQIYTGASSGSTFIISGLFTVQILVAASAVYDVIERVHIIRWYDEHPGAREYEARSIEAGGIDPRATGIDK